MKTEQQLRFEAAWIKSKAVNADHAVMLASVSEHTGAYHGIESQAAWESWQLAESSVLALAAALCESELARNDGISCAEAIRALMNREGVKP